MDNITLNNLDQIFNDINVKLGNLTGQGSAIKSSIDSAELKIVELKEQKIRESKAVELLNLVQKVTRETTKQRFEQLVSYAIQYIFEDNRFEFALEFDRRGALGTLDFNIKTPELQEKADIIDTDSGGVISIVSFALRLVLLEIFQPKNEGFLLLDEPFTGLSGEEEEDEVYDQKAGQFLKEVSQKFNRQIIMVTHNSVYKNFADKSIQLRKVKEVKNTDNVIDIKNCDNSFNSFANAYAEELQPKKRGRPKKEKV